MGFEPTDAFTSPVFKTGAFNHSAISPYGQNIPVPRRVNYDTTTDRLCQQKEIVEKLKKSEKKIKKTVDKKK